MLEGHEISLSSFFMLFYDYVTLNKLDWLNALVKKWFFNARKCLISVQVCSKLRKILVTLSNCIFDSTQFSISVYGCWRTFYAVGQNIPTGFQHFQDVHQNRSTYFFLLFLMKLFGRNFVQKFGQHWYIIEQKFRA